MHLLVLPIVLLIFSQLRYAASSPQTADFVIVGGGTAGCALAGRLCKALPKARIILIERGLKRNKTAEFNVRAVRLAATSDEIGPISETWDSLPNPGLLGNVGFISTGNTLGGSSSTNGMQWTIPVKGSVESWNISGLTTRSSLKYYRRAYREVRFRPQRKEFRQLYTEDYIKAAVKIGFVNEFNPFDQKPRTAVWTTPIAATPNGRRRDACTAYISNSKCRRNLKVLESSTVTKLIISKKKPRQVLGVEYVHSKDIKLKRRRRIWARKEVIVSAGPYGSPKLLQLSGIGKAEHLRKAGIKQLVDLDVGGNVQGRGVNFILSSYSGVPLEPSNNSSNLQSSRELRKWKKGRPSVFGSDISPVLTVTRNLGYQVMTTAFGPVGLDVPLLASTCLTNPRSFGYLKLRDSNPFSQPEVQLNLLSQKVEVREMRMCIRRMFEIHKNFEPSFNLSQVTPSSILTESGLRNSTIFAYHFVGGCAVDSVVDNSLNVYGVRRLRVVDASVLKKLPISAGPLSSVYMLAEYTAERISRLYRREFSRRE